MRDGGSTIWGAQYPLTLQVKNLAFLEPEEAVRYLTLPSLPTMAGREAGRPVPSRGRVGQSANPIPHREGEQVAEAVLKLAGRRPEPTAAPSPVGPSPAPRIAPPPPRVAAAVGPAAAAALGDEAEATEHRATQALLLKLGRKLGLDVWAAKNDRAKLAALNGGEAGPMLDALPRLSGNPRVQNTVELIDALWLRDGDYEAAFEVECTTSVFSGLLRMSDLVALQPGISIRMFIVAPEARREKVRAEIHRPTFSLALSKPLHQRCRFISIENLRKLEQVPEIFWGGFKIDVIEKISDAV